MPALRFCRSCTGPRPRAAIRCPWCLNANAEHRAPPEHLFGIFDRRSAAPTAIVHQEEKAR